MLFSPGAKNVASSLLPAVCALSLALGRGTRGPFWYFLLLLPLLPANSHPGHYSLLFFAQFSNCRKQHMTTWCLRSLPKYFMCGVNRSRADASLKGFCVPGSTGLRAGHTVYRADEGRGADVAPSKGLALRLSPCSCLHFPSCGISALCAF